MNTTPLSTKIRIPSPPRSLVPRPALVARLKACLTRPLVLVSAPAGFGKTSLATEFLASESAKGPESFRVAWLSLDADDDDPVRFWVSIAAALDRAEGGAVGVDSPFAVVRDSAASTEPPPATELAATLLDVVARGEERCLLVLDDFHFLSSPALLDSFALFVERLPGRLSLLVLSRSDPHIPLARFRARGLLAELRAADLRFAPEEAERFLALVLGPRLTSAQAAIIDEKAEGWAAGLQMAALSLSRRSDVDAFILGFSGSDRFVLEFLVEEVLAAQSAELREFLFASAMLDRFSAPLLDAVLAPQVGAEEVLRRLEAANLFLVQLDEAGIWFRYHHLFAEALRARGRTARPGLENAILLSAAAWHEAHGDIEEAIGLLLRAGERERAADFLAGAAYSILARGERATLAARIAQVGEEAVLTRPELAETAGWASVFSGRGAEADAFIVKLRASAAAFPSGRVRDDLAGAAAAMHAFLGVQRGLLSEADASAREAESLLGEDRSFSRSIVPFVLGTCARMHARWADSAVFMGELLARARAFNDVYDLMMAHFEVCLTERFMGRLVAAERAYLDAMAELSRRGVRSFGSSCKVHGNYGEILYERDELERLETLLAHRVDGGVDWILPTDILITLSPLIKSRIARGRLDEAREFLARAADIESHAGVFPRLLACFRDLRARLAIAQGRPEPLAPLGYPSELVSIAEAGEATDIRLLVAAGILGDAAAAREAADRAAVLAALSGERGGMALFIEAKAFEAAARETAGNRESALAALLEALPGARAEGFVRSLVDAGEPLRKLLEALVEGESPAGEGERAYAGRLLSAFADARREAAVPAIQRPAKEFLPPVTGFLSPRELEVLALLASGLSNRDIAERLFISVGTVKTHVHHLAEKFEAPNRSAIVARAMGRAQSIQ